MMMTLREVTSPEGIITSSSAHTSSTDPQKSKIARRRRLEIRKLKAICKEELQNEDVYSEKEAAKSTWESHGVMSVMGERREMEDAVTVEKCFVVVGGYKKYDFYGVYDGHGGSHVAEACRDRVLAILAEEIRGTSVGGGGDTWRSMSGRDVHDRGGDGVVLDWEWVIQKCFERMDKEVGGGMMAEEVEEMTVGSTVVAALVGDEEVVVANCGDSRAILCRGGVAVPLSFDHKPDRPDELARIEAAGGRVINWNGFRVLGVLATSRSIGDHYLKPYVSSTPEVTISKRTEADEFLVLATDGLWDVMSNEVVCNVVRRCLTGKIHRRSQEFSNYICDLNKSRAEVAAALLTELAVAEGSKDNISVIVVELKQFSRFSCSYK